MPKVLSNLSQTRELRSYVLRTEPKMPRAVNTNVDFLFNDPFVLNLITRSLNSKAIMAKDARPWVDVTADRQNRALPWHDRHVQLNVLRCIP